jgi:hypothetical protein
MAALKDARREKFAALVAEGMAAVKAYPAAGFKPHRSNPSTLLKDALVAARVVELKAERAILLAQAHAEANAEFAAKEKITQENLLERAARLLRITEGTEKLKVSLIEDGKVVEAEESHFDANQARQLIALLGGELFGMFAQRSKLDANVNSPPPAEPVANPLEAAKAYLAGWGSRHVASKPSATPTPEPVPAPTVAETGTA